MASLPVVLLCCHLLRTGDNPAATEKHEDEYNKMLLMVLHDDIMEQTLTVTIKWVKPEHLLQLARKRYDMLNCIHLSAIFTRLKALCDKQPLLLQLPDTQQLQQLLQQRLSSVQQNSTVRELATILWAASFLGCTDLTQQLLPLILQPQHLAQATTKTVVLVLLGLERAGIRPEQQQAQQLLGVLTGSASKVRPDDVSTSLRIVASMGLAVPQQQLQNAVASFTAQLRQAGVHAVVDMLWALANMQQLQGVPATQMQQLLQAAAEGVGAASPAAAAKIQKVLKEVEALDSGTGKQL